MFESRCYSRWLQHSVVAFFGFGRRDVANGLQEPPIVEPVDPFEGSVLHRLERAPRPAPVDDLGLIEAIDCLGERVVVRVADTAAFLTHLPSVCAVQPILAAIEETAAHRNGWSPA